MFSHVFQILPHSMKIRHFWLRCSCSSSAASPCCSSATDAAQRTAVAADAAGGTSGGTGDGRAIDVTGIWWLKPTEKWSFELLKNSFTSGWWIIYIYIHSDIYSWVIVGWSKGSRMSNAGDWNWWQGGNTVDRLRKYLHGSDIFFLFRRCLSLFWYNTFGELTAVPEWLLVTLVSTACKIYSTSQPGLLPLVMQSCYVPSDWRTKTPWHPTTKAIQAFALGCAGTWPGGFDIWCYPWHLGWNHGEVFAPRSILGFVSVHLTAQIASSIW